MDNKEWEKHLKPKDDYTKVQKEINKPEIERNLNEIDNHPGIKLIAKELELLEVEEQLRFKEVYIRQLITEEGEKELNLWRNIKRFSFILGILFLVILYFSFWFFAKDLKVAEESFTSLFCLS